MTGCNPDPHMAIPPLRVALQTNSLTRPAVDKARPLADLHREVSGIIEPLRRVCDYVRVGQLLPPVIDELYRHSADPEDGQPAGSPWKPWSKPA